MALSPSNRAFFTPIDTKFAIVEECLNWCGYIPVVSIFTASLRQLAGLVIMAVAFVFLIFNSVRQLFITDQDENKELLAQTYHILHYAKHGFYNVFRAQIEFIPFIQFVNILYDHAAGARVTYPLEPRAGSHPFFPA